MSNYFAVNKRIKFRSGQCEKVVFISESHNDSDPIVVTVDEHGTHYAYRLLDTDLFFLSESPSNAGECYRSSDYEVE